MIAIGKSDNRHQRAAHVEKKNDDDKTDDEALLHELFLQRRDRSKNEIRTVIGGDDLNACRKSRLDLFEFLFDPLD